MIDQVALRTHCLGLTGVYEDFPFGPDVAVYKVQGKMFAYIPRDDREASITLKCDPVEAELLREMYRCITPGYHMNKKHWNTIVINGEIDEARILEMIDDAYWLVRQKLKKADRAALQTMEAPDSN